MADHGPQEDSHTAAARAATATLLNTGGTPPDNVNL
jgi:hypothetical protein